MNIAKIAAVAVGMAAFLQTAVADDALWNESFYASKELAKSANAPLVLIWSNPGCTECAKLDTALAKSTVSKWMDASGYVFCHASGTADVENEEAKAFAKTVGRNVLTGFPFVRIWWPKPDGTEVSMNFTGRTGSMTVKKGTLEAQFMQSVDAALAGYAPKPLPTGGDFSFAVGDAAGDRLEAEPSTSFVHVPILRTKTESTTCSLQVSYPSAGAVSKTIAVAWGPGQTNQTVRVETLKGTAKKQVTLKLLTKEGSVSDTTHVTYVAAKANSTVNPKWIGESFDYGEWTMDLDAALKKTRSASGNAYTIVMFTGALWCPWCQGLDAGVLSKSTFSKWVKKNKIALVELDNPKRSAADDTAAGKVSSVPDGAPPTLLRHEPGENKLTHEIVSGADYLSRKMIAQADAERILQRNHALGYKGGAYCAPESLRSGYPTLVLLRKDGSVAGRLNYYAPTTTGFDTTENMTRLGDLLLLAAEGRVEDGYRTTTTLELSPGTTVRPVFQINDRIRWYALKGLAGTHLRIAAEGARDLILTVADKDGNALLSGRNRLVGKIPAGAGYLKVETFADDIKYGKKSTRFEASLSLETGDESIASWVEFKGVSKGEALVLNDLLYHKCQAEIPLVYTAEDETRSYLAHAAISVSAANKIKASVSISGRKVLTLSGTWDDLHLLTGEARGTLVGGGVSLSLALDATGRMSAALSADELVLDGTAMIAGGGSFTPFVGSYTVTLKTVASEGGDAPTGHGFLTLKLTSSAAKSGKMTYSGYMPNGTAVSGSSLLAMAPDGTAVLPIFKLNSNGGWLFSAMLTIAPYASSTWGAEGSSDVIRASDGILPQFLYSKKPQDWALSFEVYGGYFKSGTGPQQICRDYGLDTGLTLSIEDVSGRILLDATANGFKLGSSLPGFSISFAKATGIFSGNARTSMCDGTPVKGTFRGVVTPDPSNCDDCSEDSGETVKRPFGIGSFTYKIGGKSYGVPVIMKMR